jgi:hypothetical protein
LSPEAMQDSGHQQWLPCTEGTVQWTSSPAHVQGLHSSVHTPLPLPQLRAVQHVERSEEGGREGGKSHCSVLLSTNKVPPEGAQWSCVVGKLWGNRSRGCTPHSTRLYRNGGICIFLSPPFRPVHFHTNYLSATLKYSPQQTTLIKEVVGCSWSAPTELAAWARWSQTRSTPRASWLAQVMS